MLSYASPPFEGAEPPTVMVADRIITYTAQRIY